MADRTLTYDYGDRLVVIGPLALVPTPNAHDLCREHADRITAPAGWHLMRHEVVPQ